MSSKRTVLVVEDNAELERALARFFRSVGWTVLSASGPVRALELMDEVDGDVGVVLTDFAMEEASGEWLLHQVRERWPKVPVVLMSGLRISQAVRDAFD